MRLFITIEAQKAIEIGLSDIFRNINNELSFVTKKNVGLEETDNYGVEFRVVSIIPTCVDDNCWISLGWKERKLIRYTKREADIRLRMDYDRFVGETLENKRLMFIDIIIKSINVIIEKSKLDFKGEKLISDILETLKVTLDDLDRINCKL